MRLCGLRDAEDWEIWNYAAAKGFTVVSKDADFLERSLVQGPPPKIIRIALGNCSTSRVEELIRSHELVLAAFEQDADAGTIEIL